MNPIIPTYQRIVAPLLGNDMILSINTSSPVVLGSGMLRQGMSLASLLVEVLSVCASRDGIVVPEETSLTELWDEKLSNIFEGLREKNITLWQKIIRYK